MNLTWNAVEFDELTPRQLYGILALRSRVFVVEQRCIYQDTDGLDVTARHLWAEQADHADEPVAYLRILPAGVRYGEVSIGRVIVAPSHRGKGLAHELVRRGIALSTGAIRISAQAHLEELYRELGFARASDNYDEDGIAHLEMLRTV